MVRLTAPTIVLLALAAATRGDGLLYAYEGDMLPYEEAAGWLVFNPCDQLCTESLENGHFVLGAPSQTGSFNYHLPIAYDPEVPPATLWVEWQFRSNHPLGPNFYTCDGWFTVHYKGIFEWFLMYGDAVFPADLAVGVFDLELYEFHTYRFESLDGVFFRLSVDGDVFLAAHDNHVPNGANSLQFGGDLGCGNNDWVPDMRNEWDMIRFGTISHGERIVASEPHMGFLDPGMPQNLALDRFTVTYDSPAYAYIDDITVSTTCDAGPPCAPAPQVIATKRLDNGPPEVLEVLLDRPLPPGERTTFTFTDVDPADPANPTINTVAYTFQRGDVNADGQWNLRDFAALQSCFFTLASDSHCAAFDYDVSIFIDDEDYAAFVTDFMTQGP